MKTSTLQGPGTNQHKGPEQRSLAKANKRINSTGQCSMNGLSHRCISDHKKRGQKKPRKTMARRGPVPGQAGVCAQRGWYVAGTVTVRAGGAGRRQTGSLCLLCHTGTSKNAAHLPIGGLKAGDHGGRYEGHLSFRLFGSGRRLSYGEGGIVSWFP